MNRFKVGDLLRVIDTDPTCDIPFGTICKVLERHSATIVTTWNDNRNFVDERFEKINLKTLTKVEKVIYGLDDV
jgi:hypothetical protein